jgi:hypothetical protein
VSQFLLERLLLCNWHLVNLLVLLLHLLFPDMLLNHESERIDVLANIDGVMDSQQTPSQTQNGTVSLLSI